MTETEWAEYDRLMKDRGYAVHPDTGVFMVRPPEFERATFPLDGWKVVWHDDGTASVSPSIWIGPGQPDEWHGWLRYGTFQRL